MNFTDELVLHMPRLKKFARHLARNPDRADDLVQETMLRALTRADQFQLGTNLFSWLARILQNIYFDEVRARKPTEPLESLESIHHATAPDQVDTRYAKELVLSFWELPADWRNAVLLASVNKCTYKNAAFLSGVAPGTIASRLFRGREEFRKRIALET